MRILGLSELFILGVWSASALAADVLEPGENLVVEGIPAIPSSLIDEVSRFTESRSAAFLDWHPVEREMLLSTRFGNTNQVHRLRKPLGARSQLTYFREPVSDATFDPQAGRFFLLTKDLGGNEFHQIFRFDLETSRTILLTDGGRSQNGSWVWSPAEDRIVYASTARNGADRDLWTLVPGEPDSRKLLVELTGGGWSPLDWSRDGRQVLARNYLSINQSRLYLFDLDSKQLKPLTPADEEFAYGSARFAKGNSTIYVTSDRHHEFLRLMQIDPNAAAGEDSRRLLPIDIPWDIEAFEISPDGKHLALVANVAGVSRLFLLDLENPRAELQPIDAWPPSVIDLGT